MSGLDSMPSLFALIYLLRSISSSYREIIIHQAIHFSVGIILSCRFSFFFFNCMFVDTLSIKQKIHNASLDCLLLISNTNRCQWQQRAPDLQLVFVSLLLRFI